MPALFSQMVDGDIDSDPGEPMREGRAPIETVQRPPGFKESFLGEIFEVVMVALISIQYGENVRLMALDEFGEIVQDTASDSGQELGVIVHRSLI
jgi:hypothetical protein